MSAFATPTLQVPRLNANWDDEDQPIRQQAVDSIIAQNRKATPQSVVNQRSTPRLSIAELNDLDIDQVRERFAKTRLDDRGPVVRFLDVLDLPRNTVAGLLAPGIRRRKEAEGDTATLGQGRVMFSDILNDMGVKNRVVRGVVGFLGDMALDPLTYAGPAGWGVKGASNAGRTAQLTKRFASAAHEAVGAAKLGREAADPLIREYIRTAGLKSADEVGTALFGSGRSRLNKAMRVLGEEREGKGVGLLTDALDDVIHPLTAPKDAERIRAAKAVLGAYGRDNAPGLRVGRNAAGKLAVEAGSNPNTTIKAGTGFFHVPFTDLSISGPAITNRARMGIAAGQLARGVETSGKIDPELKAIQDLTNLVNSRVSEVEGLQKRQTEIDRLNPIGAQPERTAAAFRLREVMDELPALQDQMSQRVRSLQAKPLANPADILYAQKLYKANADNARALMADAALREVEPAAMRSRWDELRGEFDDEIADRVRLKKDAHEAENQAAYQLSREPVDTDWPMKPLKYERKEFDDVAARGQATREFKDEYRQRLRPDDQAIFNMSPESLEANSRLADAFHAKMGANVDLATSLQGPLDATLTSKDRSIADAAKMVLGLSPDDLGHSMFAPLRAITESLSEDREGALAMLAKGAGNKLANTDAALRGAFGRHSGKTHDLIRDYLRATSPLSNPMTQETIAAVSKDIRSLIDNPEHALKPADRVELERLVGTMVDTVDKMPGQNDYAFQIIDEAAKSGLLSRTAHPGLFDAAMGVAKKWNQELKALGQTEVQAGQLSRLKEGYGLPSLLTREAATRISNQKAFQAGFRGQPGSAGGNVGKLVESFQKPRSTDLYRWTDEAGNAREFMDGERVYANIGEDTLKRMDPDAANQIRAIQQTIKDFDALPPSKQPLPIPTSRAQVNKWVKESGRFKWLTGGALDGDFFETAVSNAIASRFGSSYKSYLHGRLMDFATQHGRAMNAEKFRDYQTAANGATFTFNNGAKGTLYKSPKGPILSVGDQRFRQLNPAVVLEGKYNPAQAVLGDKHAQGMWFPEEVADLIEKANAPFREESSIEGIIKGADELNKLWKSTTLFHPSWTIGDLVGGVILATHAGVTPAQLIRNSKNAMRIVSAMGRHDPEALSKIELNLGGRTLNGLDVVRGEHSNAIFGAGNAYEAAMQMLGNGHMVPSQTYSMWKNPGKAIKEEWDRAAQFAQADVRGREWASAQKVQQGAAQAKAFVNEGVMRRVMAPWFQLNATVNDVVRTSAYLSLLEQGNDAAQAARKVSEHLFDMTTMTGTEQNIRKLLPFYSWMKNSGVYGIRMLMEDPKFFNIAPRLKHALEEAANGEENLPEYQRPSWMRDSQAALFGKGDTRQAVLFGTMLPTEAATYFANGLGAPALGAQALQDSLSYFANSLSPVLKVPLELASHREWFTKREIGGDAGDLTIPEYLAGQVRPLKELGIGNVRQGPIQAAFGRSPAEGVSRLALGGRLQPAGDERLKFHIQREQDAKVTSLRKRINLAEREGAGGESLDKRAELLRVIEQSANKGVKVPKKLGEQARSAGA